MGDQNIHSWTKGEMPFWLINVHEQNTENCFSSYNWSTGLEDKMHVMTLDKIKSERRAPNKNRIKCFGFAFVYCVNFYCVTNFSRTSW